MGQWIELDTPQGAVAAWQAEPPSSPKAGLVVVQEIFGVNAHIRDVADGYAAEGYAVLAPASLPAVPTRSRPSAPSGGRSSRERPSRKRSGRPRGSGATSSPAR